MHGEMILAFQTTHNVVVLAMSRKNVCVHIILNLDHFVDMLQ